MVVDIENKFKEAFVLFSSGNDKLELYNFYELVNSFGIILSYEEKAELPNVITLDYWLEFAKSHYNYDEPFKHIMDLNDKESNIQIKPDNFVMIMKALDTRLTDIDFNILMEIANPDQKEFLDLKTISQKLAEAI